MQDFLKSEMMTQVLIGAVVFSLLGLALWALCHELGRLFVFTANEGMAALRNAANARRQKEESRLKGIRTRAVNFYGGRITRELRKQKDKQIKEGQEQLTLAFGLSRNDAVRLLGHKGTLDNPCIQEIAGVLQKIFKDMGGLEPSVYIDGWIDHRVRADLGIAICCNPDMAAAFVVKISKDGNITSPTIIPDAPPVPRIVSENAG